MQVSDLDKRHPLIFLSQLPKERVVLNYVLSKLAKNSSPERYDLIAAVFNLHLTSAGFDPMALSKARFKRVKASDFRQALREIDAEIALIIQTEEYRQVLSRQTYLPDLFQQYLLLSASVRQSGTVNTKLFKDFSNLLQDKDASDLMLGFIRQHKALFEESFKEEELNEFLKEYDSLMLDQLRKNNLVRAILELRLNEMLAMRGVRIIADIYRLWQTFCDHLSSEKNNVLQLELFDKVLRTGVLTAWPNRNLRSYLSFISDKTDSYHFSQVNHRYLLFAKLAQYSVDAGYEERIQWLDEAEDIARKINKGNLRAECRLIRAKVMSDYNLLPEAIRFLDEAEHHIHRIAERDFELKNTWVDISRTRVVVYAQSHLNATEILNPAIFEAQVYLTGDAGRHRTDIKCLVQEIEGLSHFLQKNWIAAYECFAKAMESHKDEEEDQPMHIVCSFFCELLSKSGKPENAELEMRRLQEGREAFYSFTWTRLLQSCQKYYLTSSRETSEF